MAVIVTVTRCVRFVTKFAFPNKSHLKQHGKSSKHAKAVNTKKQQVDMGKFFKKKALEPNLEEQVAKAEVLLGGFMAEHRTPFLQADHLTDVMKAMFPDSKIAQKLQMKRTKASYVIQYGIAHEEKRSLASICQDTMFSLIIDESTDVSVEQILAVMVRFFHDSKVFDALLDVVVVDDATARGLYKSVKDLLASKAIPFRNILGFASDNCSTTMGEKSGFQALLKADNPSVFVMGCICHSFALCASYAAHHLPSWPESVMKDICCYFSRSSK